MPDAFKSTLRDKRRNFLFLRLLNRIEIGLEIEIYFPRSRKVTVRA